MSTYRTRLSQLDGGPFLTDAGLETDLIFDHGLDIPAFAAHALLSGEEGREALGSHAELDACTALDAGDADDPAPRYHRSVERMPRIDVVGGRCRSDIWHVTAIVDRLLD